MLHIASKIEDSSSKNAANSMENTHSEKKHPKQFPTLWFHAQTQLYGVIGYL